LDHGFNIKSNLVYDPRYLAAEILPRQIRQSYWSRYQDLVDRVQHITLNRDYNASNPHNAQANVAFELRMVESVLHREDAEDSDSALAQLVSHCGRWDQIYALNARELYPEWTSILDRYGYPG